MTKEQELRLRMISYDGGDPARIQHFIKVYTFAVMIGEGEQLPRGDDGDPACGGAGA